jgi:SAM-dependent methyltransferase
MDDLSKEYVKSFFDKSLSLHGDRPEAVRWSTQGQLMHYRALLDIGDISGSTILDFGCGKGDFYHFLRERGIEVDYVGLDLNEKLIALARGKFPQGAFRVFDIDRDRLDEQFDYIFLCGVFNLRVSDIDETIRHALKVLFGHCRRGLAFNALSAHCRTRDFDLHYVSPEEIFAYAVSHLSPYVALRHDRMRDDFTMFVYRDLHPFPEV